MLPRSSVSCLAHQRHSRKENVLYREFALQASFAPFAGRLVIMGVILRSRLELLV